jgi:hypothetical protein
MNSLPPAIFARQLARQATAIQALRFVRIHQKRKPADDGQPAKQHLDGVCV